jgi:vacuolar-type H+-ATPase subunit C/Vma6
MFGEEYTSIYPKIKSWAAALILSREKINEVLDMNLAEYVNFLRRISKKIDINTEDTVLLEGLLKQEGFFFLESVGRYLIGYVKDFVQNLGKLFEIENLKIVTRALINKRPINFLYRTHKKSRIQLEFVKEIKSLGEFVNLLSGTEYYRLASSALPRIENEKTTFYFEMNLDNYYIYNLKKKMVHLGKKEKQQIREIFFLYLNLNRILWVYRAKFNYSLSSEEIIATVPNIPGVFSKLKYQKLLDAETKEMFIEILADNSLIDLRNTGEPKIERDMYHKLLRKCSSFLVGSPFSLGVFMGFYVMNIIQVKNLITILEGKKQNLNNAEIMEMLVFE